MTHEIEVELEAEGVADGVAVARVALDERDEEGVELGPTLESLEHHVQNPVRIKVKAPCKTQIARQSRTQSVCRFFMAKNIATMWLWEQGADIRTYL